MANELVIHASFEFEKGSTKLRIPHGDGREKISIDIAGTVAIHNRQEVGFAAEEAIQLGDLDTSSLGYFIFLNRDSTNFVEIRPGTAVQDMTIVRAGKFAIFEMAPGVTAPFWIADTAAVEMEYIGLER